MAGVKVVDASDLGDDEEDQEVTPTISDGPQSPLATLRGKRAQLEATLFHDMLVPRWEEVLDGRALWVRYQPANTTVFNTAMQKRDENHRKALKAGKHGDPDWLLKANADMLVDACVAVYDLAIDEEPPADLGGDLPTFGSPELSEALGAPKNAVATCLQVYGTKPDLLLAANQLLLWSGQASKEADQSFLTS